jgi:hypothetical protein
LVRDGRHPIGCGCGLRSGVGPRPRARCQPVGERVGRHRLADGRSLHGPHAVRPDALEQVGGVHAVRDGPDAERPGQADRRPDDRLVRAACSTEATNERSSFSSCTGIVAQPGQRRRGPAVVIQRQPDPEGAELA